MSYSNVFITDEEERASPSPNSREWNSWEEEYLPLLRCAFFTTWSKMRLFVSTHKSIHWKTLLTSFYIYGRCISHPTVKTNPVFFSGKLFFVQPWLEWSGSTWVLNRRARKSACLSLSDNNLIDVCYLNRIVWICENRETITLFSRQVSSCIDSV